MRGPRARRRAAPGAAQPPAERSAPRRAAAGPGGPRGRAPAASGRWVPLPSFLSLLLLLSALSTAPKRAQPRMSGFLVGFLPGKVRITSVRICKEAGKAGSSPAGVWELLLPPHLLHPADFTALDIARGGRGVRTAKEEGGGEKRKRRSLGIVPAFLRLPRGPAPPCHLRTMHLLEMLSLGCCLAAGAVLLGPRQLPVAAAYESGHGYYEEEPGVGEPKVSCSGRPAPLLLGNAAGEIELG